MKTNKHYGVIWSEIELGWNGWRWDSASGSLFRYSPEHNAYLFYQTTPTRRSVAQAIRKEDNELELEDGE